MYPVVFRVVTDRQTDINNKAVIFIPMQVTNCRFYRKYVFLKHRTEHNLCSNKVRTKTQVTLELICMIYVLCSSFIN